MACWNAAEGWFVAGCHLLPLVSRGGSVHERCNKLKMRLSQLVRAKAMAPELQRRLGDHLQRVQQGLSTRETDDVYFAFAEHQISTVSWTLAGREGQDALASW